MTRILFVCTGNICRSPMAEYMFRDMLEKNDESDVAVESAGVMANDGRQASPPAVRVLEEEGIDSIAMHQSQPVGNLDPAGVDLLLTMTRSHLAQLPPKFETDSVTSDMLKRYVGLEGGFPDPYGGPVSRYRELRDEMKPVLEKLYEKEVQEP